MSDAVTITYLPGVSVAIFHDGRFLLVLRDRAPSKGLYAFPGGRVNKGESDEDAVRRELAEETGLTVERVTPLRHLLLHGSDGQPSYRLRVFRGFGPAGTLLAGDDAAEAGWFTLEEMAQLPIIPSVLETARNLSAEGN